MKRRDEAVREDRAGFGAQAWIEALGGGEPQFAQFVQGVQYVPEEDKRSGAFDVEFSVLGGRRRRPSVPIRSRGRRR